MNKARDFKFGVRIGH